MRTNPFTFNGSFYKRTEWIIANDPDDKWGVLVFKSFIRPIDKMGEVVQKDSLDLVFLGNI